MIPGVPNPWLLLAAVLAMLGCFTAGNFHGHQAERKTWEVSTANQRATAGEMLARSETRRLDAERAHNIFKDEVERDHADNQKRISDLYERNRGLLAAGRLRDKQGSAGGTCRADGVPADSRAAGGDSSAAAGCELSDATSQSLLVLARDADRTAAYAAACHRWAVGLSPLTPNSKDVSP